MNGKVYLEEIIVKESASKENTIAIIVPVRFHNSVKMTARTDELAAVMSKMFFMVLPHANHKKLPDMINPKNVSFSITTMPFWDEGGELSNKVNVLFDVKLEDWLYVKNTTNQPNVFVSDIEEEFNSHFYDNDNDVDSSLNTEY